MTDSAFDAFRQRLASDDTDGLPGTGGSPLSVVGAVQVPDPPPADALPPDPFAGAPTGAPVDALVKVGFPGGSLPPGSVAFFGGIRPSQLDGSLTDRGFVDTGNLIGGLPETGELFRDLPDTRDLSGDRFGTGGLFEGDDPLDDDPLAGDPLTPGTRVGRDPLDDPGDPLDDPGDPLDPGDPIGGGPAIPADPGEVAPPVARDVLPFAPADVVVMLFDAAFARVPGEPALAFWTDRLESGLDQTGLATAFLDSPEFTARFGDPEATPPEAFVTDLFATALGREPDPEGLAFWTEELESGAATREEVLLRFAGSAESRVATELAEAHAAPPDDDFLLI